MQLPNEPIELGASDIVSAERIFVLSPSASAAALVLPQWVSTSTVLFGHVRSTKLPWRPTGSQDSFSSVESAKGAALAMCVAAGAVEIRDFIDCDGSCDMEVSLLRATKTLRCSVMIVPRPPHTGWLRWLRSTPKEAFLANLTQQAARGVTVYFPRDTADIVTLPSGAVAQAGKKKSNGKKRFVAVLDMNRVLFYDPPAVVRAVEKFAMEEQQSAGGGNAPCSVLLLGCFTAIEMPPSADQSLSAQIPKTSFAEEYRRIESLAADTLSGIAQRCSPIAAGIVCETVHNDALPRLRALCDEADNAGDELVIAVHRYPSLLLNSTWSYRRSYVWRDTTERLVEAFSAHADIVVTM